MAETLNILNIGGHPKDVVMYAGGTMMKHVAKGDNVTMLTPYHGLSHHEVAISAAQNGIKPDFDALMEERKDELNRACEVLGIHDVHFLGYDDSIPVVDKDIVEDIADIIGAVRPNIIVTHWPHDTVSAHASATQMTLLAIEAASSIRPGKSYKPFGGDNGGYQQVFFHTQIGRTNVLENLAIRIPSVVVDISDVVKQKAHAMNEFKSQHYGEDSPLERKLGESLDGSVFAIHKRVGYAETFIPHNSEVYSSLPVSEYGMRLTERTQQEKRLSMLQLKLDEFNPKSW